MNGTHDYLIGKGIIPKYCVLLDARPENVRFIEKPHKNVTYLVAAQCHPSIFDKLKGYKVIQWVAHLDGCDDIYLDAGFKEEEICKIYGGGTVGLKSICLANLLGYKDYHLYGYDSCHTANYSHAYPQELNDGLDLIPVEAAGRRFICSHSMAQQAMNFELIFNEFMKKGLTMTVYGDGLIQWLVKQQEIRDVA